MKKPLSLIGHVVDLPISLTEAALVSRLASQGYSASDYIHEAVSNAREFAVREEQRLRVSLFPMPGDLAVCHRYRDVRGENTWLVLYRRSNRWNVWGILNERD